MSVAAAQAAEFYRKVVETGAVFTFTHDDELLVFSIHDREVIPFWSSRSRLENIQSTHLKYKSYSISEVSLQEFLTENLPLLEAEGISIGVNWSGPRLTGYDLTVLELKANIAYWQEHGQSRRREA
jgi:hypothetical protein